MMLRYEDLVADIATVTKRLNEFLNTSIAMTELISLGHNSSFRNGARKTITETETRICQSLCAKEMTKLGYTAKPVHMKVSDLGDLALVSAKFTAFQAKRFIKDQDARRRISNFLGGLGKS